jgi:hypothetical protein
VKNETVIQTGTQSTRENRHTGALAVEPSTMGRKWPGWRLRVSIALGKNFFFSVINSILTVSLTP